MFRRLAKAFRRLIPANKRMCLLWVAGEYAGDGSDITRLDSSDVPRPFRLQALATVAI
jgi:hypothetical protein